MLNSAKVKKAAKASGADIVGIASMDRFEGAPKQMDPRYIFPDAKAMIVMGFRILKGTLRGIEEGTFFIAYPSMGYAGINKLYGPMALWNFCKMVEDEGYEAVPMPNNWQYTYAGLNLGQGDENDPEVRKELEKGKDWSRPVSPEKPAPDVAISLRIAAFCAGLGEIGYSKMFLTPEFGPRVRFAAVLTDAPLKPDPLFEGKLCDRCMSCVRACTSGAISATKTTKVTVAGRELEWAEIDMRKCADGTFRPTKRYNPFIVTKEDEKQFSAPGGGHYKLPPQNGYGRALEGASGCIRACMVHLEGQGKLKNKFKNPFRKKKPWNMDWYGEELKDGEIGDQVLKVNNKQYQPD